MKLIAFYLPQFHSIPENDKWWGAGFTEWVNVKKARPLFDGHCQPRIPYDNNYYNLLDVDTLRWQTRLAKKNHIWGFCFYHYWFGEKLLLGKPMELFLENKDIDMPFCISWANENWTNQWVSNSPQILIRQEYGDEREWERHFKYLLPFFRDDRYIKNQNKPIVVIYKPTNFERINEMLECWDTLAIKNGFSGVSAISQISYEAKDKSEYFVKMDYLLEYQPTDIFIGKTRTKNVFVRQIKSIIKKMALGMGIDLEGKKISAGLVKYNYADIWKKVLEKGPESEQSVPGCFVDWDNTPRKGNKGTVLVDASPTLFKEYFLQQVKHCKSDYQKDFMFIFAWNEWAEGGYLEPDEAYQEGYLTAIKETLEELGEVPDNTANL